MKYPYHFRWIRIWKHLSFQKAKFNAPIQHWFDWPIDLVFLILDSLYVFEIYSWIINSREDKRLLTEVEYQEAFKIFEDAINYQHIRIIENVKPIKKGIYLAYVLGNTIKCTRQLDLDVFIHEMVHVWQYQQFGSLYIYRALKAQMGKQKYDYGGPKNLALHKGRSEGLLFFNFEQQAQIIQDYWIRKQDQISFNADRENYMYFASYIKESEKGSMA